MRMWDMGGSNTKVLDYSHPNGNGTQDAGDPGTDASIDSVRDAYQNIYSFSLLTPLASK